MTSQTTTKIHGWLVGGHKSEAIMSYVSMKASGSVGPVKITRLMGLSILSFELDKQSVFILILHLQTNLYKAFVIVLPFFAIL